MLFFLKIKIFCQVLKVSPGHKNHSENIFGTEQVLNSDQRNVNLFKGILWTRAQVTKYEKLISLKFVKYCTSSTHISTRMQVMFPYKIYEFFSKKALFFLDNYNSRSSNKVILLIFPYQQRKSSSICSCNSNSGQIIFFHF